MATEKISREKIRKIDSKKFENIRAKIIDAEVDENDQKIEAEKKSSGRELKNELMNVVQHPESKDAFEKDLMDLGLKNEQYYVRKRIMEAVLEYIEELTG